MTACHARLFLLAINKITTKQTVHYEDEYYEQHSEISAFMPCVACGSGSRNGVEQGVCGGFQHHSLSGGYGECDDG